MKNNKINCNNSKKKMMMKINPTLSNDFNNNFKKKFNKI